MTKFKTLKFLVAFFFLLACLHAASMQHATCQQGYPEIAKNELTKDAAQKYTGAKSRDPFALPLALKKKLKSLGAGQSFWPELKLYGILLGEGNLQPKALINNEVVSIGESIGPAKVVEIRKDSVKMELDGEFRTLTIDK